MDAIDISSRAEIQAIRIGMAACGAGLGNARDLHRALKKVMGETTPHYETVRRILAGDFKRELPKTLLERIAEVTGFSYKWVVGDPNVELPDRLNRVNPRYIKSPVGRAAYSFHALAA